MFKRVTFRRIFPDIKSKNMIEDKLDDRDYRFKTIMENKLGAEERVSKERQYKWENELGAEERASKERQYKWEKEMDKATSGHTGYRRGYIKLVKY